MIDRTINDIWGELSVAHCHRPYFLLTSRGRKVDEKITSNKDKLYGNIAAYQAAFPQGIAGAYGELVASVILPQITLPPNYLTSL